MLKKLVLLLAAIAICTHSFETSIFWCGFGGNYCGQSTDDDVNPSASFIILAFANTNPDGTVDVDNVNFPTTLVNAWQSNGKKVFLSVGGQNGNWNYVFASQTSIDNFVSSLVAAVVAHGLDGVDLDIQNYNATPRTVANAIIQLKTALNGKLIIVSPQDITVYQGTSVPSPDASGVYFNYFVPIIQLADNYIDYYQPQAYNNWYDGETGGSLRYLQDVYENWRNLQGTGQWDVPIPGFNGVSGQKLLLGLQASASAGNPAYFATPDIINQFKYWITLNNLPLKGFMLWDSHWDSLNGFAASNAIHSPTPRGKMLSIFYCGFGPDYCGQSTTDDVNPNADLVILAFANPQADGFVFVDTANFPTALVNSWQSSGKKVLISVGGQNGNWGFVFATSTSISNFVSSLANIITTYSLDGVDLDIQSYNAAPQIVVDTIKLLRQAIGNTKLIVVSPEDVTVIQTVSYVPLPNQGGQPWNYFVPIINLADQYIDYYQPQAYNNGYDTTTPGTSAYLQDVYLNWRNLPSFGVPITNYTGVPANKLLMGVEASSSAGQSSFYFNGATIAQFKNWTLTNNYPVQGFMIWDSHWDALNGYEVSKAIVA